MDRRTMAVTAMALLAVAAVMAASCPTDAATADDIQITPPEYVSEDGVKLTIANAGQSTFRIYIYNSSDSYLVMDVSGSSPSAYVKLSFSQSSDILLPDRMTDTGHIATVDVTVSVGEYDQSPVETATVVLDFRDMSDQSSRFEIPIKVTIDVRSAYYSADGNNKFLGLIPNDLDGALGSEWFTATVTIVAWVLIAYIVCLLVIPVFAKAFSRNSDEERRRMKRTLTSLVLVLIAILSINQCLTILGAGPEIRDGFNTLSNVLYIVIFSLMAWTVFVFVITALVRGMEKGTDSAVDVSIIPLFKMLGKIVISVLAVASILALFGVDLNGILVSAGVVTLGITLGAQNILNQFFSGIVLLSTRPFKKGDFVKIGGEVYIVRKVKLMFTEFDNWDKDQVVTIPNNVVSGGTIVNMTAEDSEARTYVYVNVVYGSDIERAQELMVQAAMEHPHVIKDGSRPLPSTRLTNVQGNAMELRLAAYVDDFDSAGGYAGQMRTRIYELFDQNAIMIPPNRMEIVVDGRRRDDDTTPDDQ